MYGVYSLLGDSITEAITSAEVCLAKFVIQVEELYGLKCCSFNVHQLVHLAHSVRHCGPLWSTAAFMFESNNHSLNKMFHGTQLISKKITLLAKDCINEETSPAVHSLFEKLREVKSTGSNVCLSEGVCGVGKETSVQLIASQVLAVQILLGVQVRNNCGIMYSRFVAFNKFFSSVDYVRSKRHINHNITFEHEQHIKYGVIVGLLAIKPECSCNIELQYCNCRCYHVVLVQPMAMHGRPLYRDTDFNVNSFFLVEVEHAGMQVAVHPRQIMKKCISLTVDEKQYFCPLPYHINDN